MKYLISAYSANPYKGSEDYTGWNWIRQISLNSSKNDEIYVLTKKYNEEAIRKGIKEEGLKNIKLIIIEVPSYLNWFREKYSVFHHMYYILWQQQALKWVKASNIKFDFLHHVTMTDFRILSFIDKIEGGIKIFGPVGGAQNTAKSLRKYEKQKMREFFRRIVNFCTIYNPFYKIRIRKYDKIYACNYETYYQLKKVCENVKLLSELAISNSMKNLIINKEMKNDCCNLIYVGRLIEKKGLMFLMDIINDLNHKEIRENWILEIYGEGPLNKKINKYIAENKLNKRVFLRGQCDFNYINKLYDSADVLLFPSLRESGGNVLVEAMAHKLPIISLQIGFSKVLTKKECGIFINTNDDLKIIQNNFVNAVIELIKKSKLRENMGNNGYNYVNEELTWENKYKEIYGKETNY